MKKKYYSVVRGKYLATRLSEKQSDCNCS